MWIQGSTRMHLMYAHMHWVRVLRMALCTCVVFAFINYRSHTNHQSSFHVQSIWGGYIELSFYIIWWVIVGALLITDAAYKMSPSGPPGNTNLSKTTAVSTVTSWSKEYDAAKSSTIIDRDDQNNLDRIRYDKQVNPLAIGKWHRRPRGLGHPHHQTDEEIIGKERECPHADQHQRDEASVGDLDAAVGSCAAMNRACRSVCGHTWSKRACAVTVVRMLTYYVGLLAVKDAMGTIYRVCTLLSESAVNTTGIPQLAINSHSQNLHFPTLDTHIISPLSPPLSLAFADGQCWYSSPALRCKWWRPGHMPM